MSLQNPMGITGPTSPAPYIQPDYRVPSSSMQPAAFPVGSNVLNIAEPVAAYSQPGVGAPPAPVAGQLTGVGGVSYGQPK
jgi:hypothetical protein